MSQQATMLSTLGIGFAITLGLHTTQTVAPARNFSMYAPSKASYALIELLANRGFDHFVFQPFSYMVQNCHLVCLHYFVNNFFSIHKIINHRNGNVPPIL